MRPSGGGGPGTLLTWSSAVWLVGALVAIVTDGIVADDTFPTVLDCCRIVALVLAIVALTTVPDRHDRWRRALLGLDGLVLAASLLYVGWTLRTGSRYGAADLEAGPRAVLLIHLGVDAVVFGFAVGLLVRAPQRARLPADPRLGGLRGGGGHRCRLPRPWPRRELQPRLAERPRVGRGCSCWSPPLRSTRRRSRAR